MDPNKADFLVIRAWDRLEVFNDPEYPAEPLLDLSVLQMYDHRKGVEGKEDQIGLLVSKDRSFAKFVTFVKCSCDVAGVILLKDVNYNIIACFQTPDGVVRAGVDHMPLSLYVIPPYMDQFLFDVGLYREGSACDRATYVEARADFQKWADAL